MTSKISTERRAITSYALFASSGLAAFITCPTSAIANALATPDASAAWLGRWNLTFTRKEGDIDTVWLFEADATGKLSAATIGSNQFGLSIPTLSIDGSRFTFTGTSVLGATNLVGTITNATINGTWTAGDQSGNFTAAKRTDGRTTALLALFDRTIDVLETQLFTTDRFNDEWRAAKEKSRASLTDKTTERELALTIRQLLRVPKLSHMGFYVLPTIKPPSLEVDTAAVIESRVLKANIAYLKISSFAEGDAYRAALDAAFVTFKNAKGLVLDLRDNTGGTLNLAMRLGDHLFAAKRSFGVFATRAGLAKFNATSIAAMPADQLAQFDGYALDDFQRDLKRESALTISSGGRAPAVFTGNVAVLHNERCASTTEALLATLKESKRARLFGVKTAGAMLSSAELAIADGYVLRLAYADFRTLAGQSIEGVGVTPNDVVSKGLFGDRILDRASSWLQAEDAQK